MTLPPKQPGSQPCPALSPGTGALILQKGEIRVINQTTCESLLPQQITPRMMCVGFLSGGVDSCQVRPGAGGWQVGPGRGGTGDSRQGLSPSRVTLGDPCPAWRQMGESSRPVW